MKWLSFKIIETLFSTLAAHSNHLGRLPGVFHPHSATDCDLIGLGAAQVILMASQS